MSDEEKTDEILSHLRHLRRQLEQFEPLLALFRGNGNGAGGYVAAAGARRALRKARADGRA